ncbi:MAG TPA: hypothetical protein VF143_01995 [Candidatus Nanopelagicales bacterium]
MTEQPEAPSAPGAAPAGPVALVAPMRRVVRVGALAAVIALPAAALVGWLVDGSAGAWGALIGMGIAVAFFAVTAVLALATARMAPTQLGMWVLGSWLLKMVLLIAVLAMLRGEDFYSRPMLFAGLLVGTVGSLLLEARIVATTKVPYTEPGPR